MNLSPPHPNLPVTKNLRAASEKIGEAARALTSVKYGNAESALHAAALASNVSEAALIGFTHAFGSSVDFRDGVWSPTAGQSDAAQAARLLARTNSVVSRLHSDLLTISNERSKERVGTTPTYNDFGDGGTPLAEYYAPTLARSQQDIQTALKVLATGL